MYVNGNQYTTPADDGVTNPWGPRIHNWRGGPLNEGSLYHGPLYDRVEARFPWMMRPSLRGLGFATGEPSAAALERAEQINKLAEECNVSKESLDAIAMKCALETGALSEAGAANPEESFNKIFDCVEKEIDCRKNNKAMMIAAGVVILGVGGYLLLRKK